MTRRRLDAWKEIARYLGRDVTTVRRWEKREGLPVHRHRHEKLGSVYAWADEIDTWSERRSVRAEPAPLPEPAPSAAVPLLAEHPQVSAADVEQPVPGRRGGAGPGPWKVGLGLAGVAALVAALASSLAPGTRAGIDRPAHIALTPPAGVIVESLVISPDGTQVVSVGKDSAGVRLWLRRLDSLEAVPIPGSDGATSPIYGGRYRVQIDQTVGTLQYTAGLIDWRRYFMPVRPITIAVRGMQYGRYGPDAEHPQLIGLYAGYQELVHGYGVGSFASNECSGQTSGNCAVFDSLIGSRLLVANIEVRAPLVGLFRRTVDYGMLPVEVAAFADAGVTWTRNTLPTFLGGTRAPVRSYGGAMRINVFGLTILELAASRPLDRVARGWKWQLGIQQGF